MPKYWYDRAAIWKDENMTDDEKEFQSRIVADKKPYFMRYIYPSVTKSWKKYVQSSEGKCLSLFDRELKDLITSADELSDDEAEFVENYFRYLPVGVGDCVMNKICRRFEEEFDNYMAKYKPGSEFDYTIMKSGMRYDASQKSKVKKLFGDYMDRVETYMKRVHAERIAYDDKVETRRNLIYDFKRQALNVCSNQYQLCDIILDIVYTKECSKQFAWDLVPDVIVENLARNNGGVIYIPEKNENGDVRFRGETYEFVPYHFEEG